MRSALGIAIFLILSLGVVRVARSEAFPQAGGGIPSIFPSRDPKDIEEGCRLIRTRPYTLPILDLQTWNLLPEAWDHRSRLYNEYAATSDPIKRSRLVMRRYGLTPPKDGASQMPMGLTVDRAGKIRSNCFLCHSGLVEGVPTEGASNALINLKAFTEDIFTIRRRSNRPLTIAELDSLGFHALMASEEGGAPGTTSAAAFTSILLRFRDADMELAPGESLVNWTAFGTPRNFPLKPAAFWRTGLKTKSFYITGDMNQDPRHMMQFVLYSLSSGQRFRSWEQDFQKIYACIKATPVPRYQGTFSQKLARRGRALYEGAYPHRDGEVISCADCHGYYRPTGIDYPEVVVPLQEVHTDGARVTESKEFDRLYSRSWLNRYRGQDQADDPLLGGGTGGYVAPPLLGLIGSGSLLHNGSIPTLSELLTPPAQRAKRWRWNPRRIPNVFEPRSAELLPDYLPRLPGEREFEIYDTRQPGQSNSGHPYGTHLSPQEKQALIEYLKDPMRANSHEANVSDLSLRIQRE